MIVLVSTLRRKCIHDTQERCINACPQCVDILGQVGHVSIKRVGHPPGKREATLGNCLNGSEGMINAAQAQPNHEDDWHLQGFGQIP